MMLMDIVLSKTFSTGFKLRPEISLGVSITTYDVDDNDDDKNNGNAGSRATTIRRLSEWLELKICKLIISKEKQSSRQKLKSHHSVLGQDYDSGDLCIHY